jgi:hypothetical protein
MIMGSRWSKHDVEFAYKTLKGWIERDNPDAISGIVTHVSASGAQSRIDFYVPLIEEGRPAIERISHMIAKILDLRLTNTGVVVHGGGVDLVYSTVRDLSEALFGDPDRLKSRRF